MPLLDHFHPPLYPTRSWESIHATWSTVIMSRLNTTLLPPGYFAETQVHIGSRVEVDVATLEGEGAGSSPRNGPAGVAVAEKVWAPPLPDLVIPAVFPDEIEVQVFGSPTGTHAVWAPPQAKLAAAVDFGDTDTFEVQIRDETRRRLVAAIELISPANKDRPAHRRDFAIKCASYLRQHVSVIVVDVVTERRDNMHTELMQLLALPPALAESGAFLLYAVAYRLKVQEEGQSLELWPEELRVGSALPTLPLWIGDDEAVPLDLEASYFTACEWMRIR
jgi:hypothetical protein